MTYRINFTKKCFWRFTKVVLAISMVAGTPSLYSQVLGCRDPMANNYNPLATVNDGSCTYNITSYTPVIKVDPISTVLNESSGLQMAGNFLWSFNDGGGAAAIYKIDTLSNAILQTVNLGGATNIDWEDISFDGTFLYVGDFGNNANGARTDLKIYKFALNIIPDHLTNPVVTIPAGQIEIINFSYSDQPQPIVATTQNNTKFDCEALIVDSGKIHLFTKNWIDLTTTHYVINSVAAGTYVASPLETLATNYLVTGADKAVGQNIVALLGYQNTGTGNHFIHLLSDYSAGKYFNGNKRRIDLPDATIMGQSEGITFRNSTYGYISNEKFVRSLGPLTLTVNQKLRSFNTSSFIPLYVLPVTLKAFGVVNANGTHKISWSFEEAVENLEVQYSTNGTDFVVLKKYSTSIYDHLSNTPAGTANYYRLAWQKTNGAIQYSNIINIKNEKKYGISNFSIKANGLLSFTLNGNTNDYYAFKLTGSDGRDLSQTKETLYNYGLNKIQISKNYIVNHFVYLSVYTNKERTTTLLYVEK